MIMKFIKRSVKMPRGRPKGSKNKPKEINNNQLELPLNFKKQMINFPKDFINKIHLETQGNFEVLKQLPDNSIDSIVTDPPYGLKFMNKKWDYDLPSIECWRECFRVLKPGGHLLAFGGTRTYHRMAVAIEDAGFEVRDMLEWIYASGFPKSLNVGKAVDKLQGNEREVVGELKLTGTARNTKTIGAKTSSAITSDYEINNTKTDITKDSSIWEGFGTALKPAHEPIILARKPLSEKTIVENVLKHGTGAIDIDGTRIPIGEGADMAKVQSGQVNKNKGNTINTFVGGENGSEWKPNPVSEHGRFPANIICTDDALNDGVMTKSGKTEIGQGGNGDSLFMPKSKIYSCFADSGSKSRYFDIDVWAEKHGLLQFPKASKRERGKGNNHPTVKPIHLMAWLVRLVTPPDGICLDPFMGSGTTALACKKLNRDFIGMEIYQEYIDTANGRLNEY